jgi:hypothetical protein
MSDEYVAKYHIQMARPQTNTDMYEESACQCDALIRNHSPLEGYHEDETKGKGRIAPCTIWITAEGYQHDSTDHVCPRLYHTRKEQLPQSCCSIVDSTMD